MLRINVFDMLRNILPFGILNENNEYINGVVKHILFKYIC